MQKEKFAGFFLVGGLLLCSFLNLLSWAEKVGGGGGHKKQQLSPCCLCLVNQVKLLYFKGSGGGLRFDLTHFWHTWPLWSRSFQQFTHL